MRKVENATRVLVVGQTPPPFHGQSIMIQMLVDGPIEGAEIHHLRMAFSDNMDQVGRFQIGKIFHLFYLIVAMFWLRLRHRINVLYFPPAGPNRIPLIRDTLLLLPTRWLFRRTVFHFQASGVSELITKLPRWQRFFVMRALLRPDAAIQLSELTVADAKFLESKQIHYIPNAADDHAGTHKTFRPNAEEVGNPRLAPNGTHFEPQRASVRAGRLDISCESGPHASALRLKNCKVSAIRLAQSAVVEGRSRTRILYVGTVCETKGILILLDALESLQPESVAIHLDIVGSFQPSSFEAVVRSRIESLKLASVVSVHGQQIGDAKWNIFAKADLFCFPSFYESEGFPCVLVEAMSFSLPIVSTHWRGIPSIVEDGETGFLVETNEPHQLAQRILQLATNALLRARMGREARIRYERQFTRPRYLESMAKVFADVVK